MFRKYFKSINGVKTNQPDADRTRHNWLMVIVYPIWVFISFYAAQLCMFGIVWSISATHISLTSLNQTVLSAVYDATLYVITLVIVMVVPWFIKRYGTSRADVGLTRLPTWGDIVMAPSGLVVYFILSSLLILLATHILPGFNADQAQNTGFSNLSVNYEYILAFITLVVIAPLAEEILFRGYLYGKLKKFVPIWIAILVTSLLFGALHGSWNLAIDTFALSIVLCLLRESTGNIWASILLHMIKNGIAFYFLFINTGLLLH